MFAMSLCSKIFYKEPLNNIIRVPLGHPAFVTINFVVINFAGRHAASVHTLSAAWHSVNLLQNNPIAGASCNN